GTAGESFPAGGESKGKGATTHCGLAPAAAQDGQSPLAVMGTAPADDKGEGIATTRGDEEREP
ncbi:MAG: hypothetical protein P1P84_07200, partial [Deferrisomatales bacterium]|nr:hypothetical protein [Deferrisomatales bacterium]